MTWTTWLDHLPHFTFELKHFDPTAYNVINNWHIYLQGLIILAIIYFLLFILTFILVRIFSGILHGYFRRQDVFDITESRLLGEHTYDLAEKLKVRYRSRVSAAFAIAILSFAALCVSTFTNSQQVTRAIRETSDELYNIDNEKQTMLTTIDDSIRPHLTHSYEVILFLANSSSLSSTSRQDAVGIAQNLSQVMTWNDLFSTQVSDLRIHPHFDAWRAIDNTRHIITIIIFFLFAISFAYMLRGMIRKQQLRLKRWGISGWLRLFIGFLGGVLLTAAEFGFVNGFSDVCTNVTGFVAEAARFTESPEVVDITVYYLECGSGEYPINPLRTNITASAASLHGLNTGEELTGILKECANIEELSKDCESLEISLNEADVRTNDFEKTLTCHKVHDSFSQASDYFCGDMTGSASLLLQYQTMAVVLFLVTMAIHPKGKTWKHLNYEKNEAIYSFALPDDIDDSDSSDEDDRDNPADWLTHPEPALYLSQAGSDHGSSRPGLSAAAIAHPPRTGSENVKNEGVWESVLPIHKSTVEMSPESRSINN